MIKFSPNKIRRVIFDLDGTLIRHDGVDEGRYMCEYLQIPQELQERFKLELMNFFRFQNRTLKNKKVIWDVYSDVIINLIPCLGYLGINPYKFEETMVEKHLLLSRIDEDVIPTLEYLVEKNYHLSIFTNGWYANQCRLMKKHKILEYFEKVYAWDNEYAKPDQRSIHRVIKGTNPFESMMVGDDLESDISLANSKLLLSVWVNRKLQKENVSIHPDYTIETIGELKLIL